jgi:hypothetical protein
MLQRLISKLRLILTLISPHLLLHQKITFPAQLNQKIAFEIFKNRHLGWKRCSRILHVRERKKNFTFADAFFGNKMHELKNRILNLGFSCLFKLSEEFCTMKSLLRLHAGSEFLKFAKNTLLQIKTL